jgi:LemA protein
MTLIYTVLAIALLALGYGVYAFNRLTRLKNLVAEGWSGIDVQLKRRAELIPNLVEVVKGYAAHESKLFREIVELRNRAPVGGGPAAQAEAGKAVTAALGKLIALSESYPDLKADQNFRKLQEQLADTEDQLQMARRYYNGTARNLNTMIGQAPSNLVATGFGFTPAEFFELDDDAQRQVPRVDLGG